MTQMQPKLDHRVTLGVSDHFLSSGGCLKERVDTGGVITVNGWAESEEEKEHGVDSPG